MRSIEMIAGIIFYYIYQTVFEIFIFGGAGYFLLKIFKLDGKHLLIKCSLIYIFCVIDLILSSWLFEMLDITINNKVIIEVIGQEGINNMFKLTAFDFIFLYIKILVGYLLVGRIIQKWRLKE